MKAERHPYRFMIRWPHVEWHLETIFTALLYSLASHDRGVGAYYDGSLGLQPLAGVIVDEIDPVSLVGIGCPTQFADGSPLVVRREGEAGMGHCIGVQHSIGISEPSFVKHHRTVPVHNEPIVIP